MGGIQKASKPPRHEGFRRRLKRSLSLSPSDSDSTQSSLRSTEEDATEIESLQEEDFSGLQSGMNLGEILNAKDSQGTDSRILSPFSASQNTRVKSVATPHMKCHRWLYSSSIQSSLETLMEKIEAILRDIEDIDHRLAAVEAPTSEG